MLSYSHLLANLGKVDKYVLESCNELLISNQENFAIAVNVYKYNKSANEDMLALIRDRSICE